MPPRPVVSFMAVKGIRIVTQFSPGNALDFSGITGVTSGPIILTVCSFQAVKTYLISQIELLAGHKPSNGVNHDDFPPHLLSIAHGCRCPTALLTIVYCQQNRSVFYHKPVTVQHTVYIRSTNFVRSWIVPYKMLQNIFRIMMPKKLGPLRSYGRGGPFVAAPILLINMGLIEDTEIGRLILHIMLAFAEFERDLIISRTQGGRAYKRATDPNYREGRKPAYSRAQLDHAVDLLRDHSYTDVANMTGISRSTITREARKRGLRKSVQ